MAKLNTMTAKLAEQSAKRKAELAATVNDIKGEEVPAVVAEEPKKAPKAAPKKKAAAPKPKDASKAAPVAVEDEVDYEESGAERRSIRVKIRGIP